jgi:hypothetical protein
MHHIPNRSHAALIDPIEKPGKVYAEISAHILRILRGDIWTSTEIARYNLRMRCGECTSTSASTGLTSIGT